MSDVASQLLEKYSAEVDKNKDLLAQLQGTLKLLEAVTGRMLEMESWMNEAMPFVGYQASVESIKEKGYALLEKDIPNLEEQIEAFQGTTGNDVSLAAYNKIRDDLKGMSPEELRAFKNITNVGADPNPITLLVVNHLLGE